jgi:hypothetical protein
MTWFNSVTTAIRAEACCRREAMLIRPMLHNFSDKFYRPLKPL